MSRHYFSFPAGAAVVAAVIIAPVIPLSGAGSGLS